MGMGCELGRGRDQKMMLKLMPIPHVLQMNEVISTLEGPMMVAGACSPVDWMYVKAKPAMATFFRAKNHSKTVTIGLQYQSECCCEQEEPSQT